MKTKHTPAPWQTGAMMTRVEFLPEGGTVPVLVADCHANKYAPKTEAELLQALEFVVEADDEGEIGLPLDLEKTIRAAIRKATGEQNICPHCDGDGEEPGAPISLNEVAICSKCGGRGEL